MVIAGDYRSHALVKLTRLAAALYYISRDGDDMLLACKERERLTDMLQIGRCRTISSRTPHVINIGSYRFYSPPRSSAISPQFPESTARFPNDSSRAEVFVKNFTNTIRDESWRIARCTASLIFHWYIFMDDSSTYSVLNLLTGRLINSYVISYVTELRAWAIFLLFLDHRYVDDSKHLFYKFLINPNK